MSFLSPLAALVSVAVVVPLAAFALLELRSRRVSGRLHLEPPPLRSRLGVPGAIAVVAGMLGIAAAQPVISGTRTHTGRSDAQVYVLFDASRSMLARSSPGAPTRFEAGKAMASRLRHAVPDVPVGIASLTDRVLPHLFPTLDSNVFDSTLRDAIGIERPPPAGTGDLATDFNSIGTLGVNNYYRPNVRKRSARRLQRRREPFLRRGADPEGPREGQRARAVRPALGREREDLFAERQGRSGLPARSAGSLGGSASGRRGWGRGAG